jgi:hypothetical protein
VQFSNQTCNFFQWVEEEVSETSETSNIVGSSINQMELQVEEEIEVSEEACCREEKI